MGTELHEESDVRHKVRDRLLQYTHITSRRITWIKSVFVCKDWP